MKKILLFFGFLFIVMVLVQNYYLNKKVEKRYEPLPVARNAIKINNAKDRQKDSVTKELENAKPHFDENFEYRFGHLDHDGTFYWMIRDLPPDKYNKLGFNESFLKQYGRYLGEVKTLYPDKTVAVIPVYKYHGSYYDGITGLPVYMDLGTIRRLEGKE